MIEEFASEAESYALRKVELTMESEVHSRRNGTEHQNPTSPPDLIKSWCYRLSPPSETEDWPFWPRASDAAALFERADFLFPSPIFGIGELSPVMQGLHEVSGVLYFQ